MEGCCDFCGRDIGAGHEADCPYGRQPMLATDMPGADERGLPTCQLYDPSGKPISQQEWLVLLGSEQQRVAVTRVGRIRLSTVWLGLDHGFGGPPLFFETMTFPVRRRDQAKRDDWQICQRYGTREAAQAGHWAWVSRLRARGVASLIEWTRRRDRSWTVTRWTDPP